MIGQTGDTHRAPRNGGFGYGNNLGIEQAYATGAPSYFYLLNPDAQVRSGAVAVLARFMEQHPEVGIAGSGFENPDGSEWPIAFRFPTLLSELDAGLETGFVTRMLRRWVVAQRMSMTSQRVDWVSGASMMLRPQMLRAVGGFDENYFLYFEETIFPPRGERGLRNLVRARQPRDALRRAEHQFSDPTLGRNRLPAYWYQSRRRYFATAFGVRHAIVIDGVALAAHTIGWLKLLLTGQRDRAVPYFIRDLARYSVLRPRNRSFRRFVVTFRRRKLRTTSDLPRAASLSAASLTRSLSRINRARRMRRHS